MNSRLVPEEARVNAGWAGGLNALSSVDRERELTAALCTATRPFCDPGVIELYEGFEPAVNRAVDAVAAPRG